MLFITDILRLLNNSNRNVLKKFSRINVKTDEGESNEEEEKSTTSSDMLKQDSESDINIHDTQDEQNLQTRETLQIHDT